MKKEKDELSGFRQRNGLGCCFGGFLFKDVKYKSSFKHHPPSLPTHGDKDKSNFNKESINHNKDEFKKQPHANVDYETAKFREMNCLEPPNFNFNPNIPPRPLYPPPYSAVPLLEYDAPKPSEPYPIKGLANSSCIVNNDTKTTYWIGKLLGKGGFAKCFELTDKDTEKVFAGKIISKICLTKIRQKEKIIKEIELHSSLRHRHVVRFHTSFEDPSNVYIILEHCSRKSLLHVLKSRKTLSDYETRYYLHQLVDGVTYIHSQGIIHRDLKLGNMLLNEKMMVKIADFGLATKVEYNGEKKMTVCGTPNYIAPEVLQKKGHSYEVDIWAIGCIMYALLVGQPPFETHSLKETYLRISNNIFKVPSSVLPAAKELITLLLKAQPSQRPLLRNILLHPFFTLFFTPENLPVSSCDHTPRPNDLKKAVRSKSENSKRTKADFSVESKNNSNSKHNSYFENIENKNNNYIINNINNADNNKNNKNHTNKLNNVENHIADTNASYPKAGKVFRKSSNFYVNKNDSNHLNNDKVIEKVNNSNKTPNVNNDNNGKVNNCTRSVQKRSSSARAKVIYTSTCKGSTKKLIVSSAGDATDGPHAMESDQLKNIFKYSKTSTFHLYEALNYCLNNIGSHAASTPRVLPLRHHQPTWITKWVDYSNKYGFGFQLSDRNVGILFNDTTRMIISTDKRTLAYNDLSNQTLFYPINTTPTSLRKKVTLLMYFSQYMDEHLIHGAEAANINIINNNNNKNNNNKTNNNNVSVCGRVFVRKWFRTDAAIVMHLSNGTIQVNFLADHTKLIVCCEDHQYIVTYINQNRRSLSYPLHSIYLRGCDGDVLERLRFARKMVENIINFSGETV